jgi:hypothetical protein
MKTMSAGRVDPPLALFKDRAGAVRPVPSGSSNGDRRSSVTATNVGSVSERVIRMFSGYRPEALAAVAQRFAEVNGQPGMVFFDAGSQAVLVIALDIAGGQIVAVRTITNPEKLRHLDESPIRVRAD